MSEKGRDILMRLVAIIFMGVFSAASIYMTYTVIHSIIMTERGRDWVPVTGTLNEQKLDTITKTFQSPNDFSAPSQRLTASYSYTVDGQTYQGTRIDFSDGQADNFSSERKSKQQELLSQVPLTVYINPQNPKESVIDPSLPAEQALFRTFFLLFPCGFAVYIMIATLMLPLKRWRKLSTPVTGIFLGGLAFWLLVFYHDSYGFKGLTLLTVMSGLLFAGIYYLVRHDKLKDWPKT